MMANEVKTKRVSTMISQLTRFVPLDHVDWFIILLAVLLGTLAKQHHFLDVPAWVLDWPLPLLLIIAGYKLRRTITEISEARRLRDGKSSLK
jgi:hypothetical protein